MKNLRVAVVPTETGNNINQQSSIEEILACEETELYALTDYFKAQNDEEFGLHWSFLIDIEKNVDLTGTNIDGVHYFQKAINISKIKAIISKWGNTSSIELELDHSPCKNSIGNGKENVSELIEEFYSDYVSTIVYNNEISIGYNDYNYEDLSDEIIDEILEIVEKYNVDMEKNIC